MGLNYFFLSSTWIKSFNFILLNWFEPTFRQAKSEANFSKYIDFRLIINRLVI